MPRSRRGPPLHGRTSRASWPMAVTGPPCETPARADNALPMAVRWQPPRLPVTGAGTLLGLAPTRLGLS